MDRPEGLSDQMWDICLSTWQYDPAKRPPFYKVRKLLEEIVEAGLGNRGKKSEILKNENYTGRIVSRKDSEISIGYRNSKKI